MKKILGMALAMGLSFSSQSEAKTTAKTAEKTSEEAQDKKYQVIPQVVPQEEAQVSETKGTTSSQNRMDKDFQATAMLVGMGPSSVNSYGVQFGKFINSNSLFLGEVTNGSDSWGTVILFGSRREINSTTVGLHYKYFTGNTFYVRFGADYRTIKYRQTYYWTSSNEMRNFDGESTALNFQLGNQWQWSGFTLGCDWVGVALPIMSRVKNIQIVSSTPEYDDIQLNRDADTYVRKISLNAVRFYIGASF